MTQQQVIVLLLKFGLVTGVISLATWVIVYGRLQPWWRDPIGITLVVKSLIVAGQLSFLALALFLHLSRLNNEIVGWCYTGFTLAIAPVMTWRTIVWVRASRQQTAPQPQELADEPADSGKP